MSKFTQNEVKKINKTIKFSNIIGQDKTINLLRFLIVKNKLNRSMIFTGISGIGRQATAVAFAAACNCENTSSVISKKIGSYEDLDACGNCTSCKLISSKNHPDLLYIESKKNEITVSDIKHVLIRSKLKPFMAKHKFILVPRAQNMNIQAANIFLKFLEEPYEKTITILIATDRSNLAPTVISRCHHVQFSPLSLKNMKKIISKDKTTKFNISESNANLSLGSFSTLKNFNDEGWDVKRKWLISTLKLLYLDKKNHIDVQLWLLFAEMLYKQKDMIENYLSIIKFCLRDILVYTFAPTKIANIDILEEISILSESLSYGYILNQIKIIQKTEQNLGSKTNPKFTLDKMVIDMAKTKTN